MFDFPAAKTCLRFLSGFRRVVFGMTRCVARPFWSITPTSGLRLTFVRSHSIICFPRIPALLCTGTAVRSFVYALHLPRRLRGKHDSAALGATVLLRPSADQPVPNAKLFSACGPVVHLAGLDRASDISPAPGAGVNVDPCSSHRSVFCRLRACVCASSGGSWPFCCTVLTSHAFSQTSQAVRCARAALGRVLSQQTRIAGCVPSETAVRRGSDVPREICAWLLLRALDAGPPASQRLGAIVVDQSVSILPLPRSRSECLFGERVLALAAWSAAAAVETDPCEGVPRILLLFARESGFTSNLVNGVGGTRALAPQ